MYQDDLTKKLAEAVRKITDSSDKHNGGKGHEDFVDLHAVDKKDDPEQKKQTEEKGDKEEYQKFFQSALKKFGVKSPSELDGDKEKEFYKYVDDNWKSDMEESTDLDEEYSVEVDLYMDPENVKKDRDFKNSNVKMKIISKKGPRRAPIVRWSGKKKDVKALMKSFKGSFERFDNLYKESTDLDEAASVIELNLKGTFEYDSSVGKGVKATTSLLVNIHATASGKLKSISMSAGDKKYYSMIPGRGMRAERSKAKEIEAFLKTGRMEFINLPNNAFNREKGTAGTYSATLDAASLKKVKDSVDSLSESFELDEAFIDIDAANPSAPGLTKLLKKHSVKMKIIAKKGPNGFPLVKLTGTRKNLEKVLNDPKDGWDDADLGEFIEESSNLDEGTYEYQVAVHLAKKDGHNFDRLPEYNRANDKHKEYYRSLAKRKLAAGEYKRGIHDSVEYGDEEMTLEEAEAYIREHGEAEGLTEEQIDELVGSAINLVKKTYSTLGKGVKKAAPRVASAAKKVGSAAVRQAKSRATTAGRADRLSSKADSLEKKIADRERLKKAKDRIQKAKTQLSKPKPKPQINKPKTQLKNSTEVQSDDQLEEKFVDTYDKKLEKAKTKDEVLNLYPKAKFPRPSTFGGFATLEKNLFMKYYFTSGGKFYVQKVYSKKGSKYVDLYDIPEPK